MISRRNARIKVLQSLYALNRDTSNSPESTERFYHQKIAETWRCYLYTLLMIAKVAEYAVKDESIKSTKHIQGEKDLMDVKKLSRNPIIQGILTNSGFIAAMKKEKLIPLLDADIIRKSYLGFAKTEDYQVYLDTAGENPEADQAVVLALYRYLSKSELFTEHVNDHFASSREDDSLVKGAIKRTIKALPTDEDILTPHLPGDDVVKELGGELLYRCIRDDKEITDIIDDQLENWDIDRVAVIDLILLKMALTEFKYLPTVPVKVSMDEYLDIAKEYSTPKSKEFINGLLDTIKDIMERNGTIVKTGRGLLE